MKKGHSILVAALVAACTMMLCGCYHPAFVVSLHEFSDPRIKTNLNHTVRDSNFVNPRTVKRVPFLHSRGFTGGEMYGPEKNGKYGLRLQVDRWGTDSMRQAAGEYLGCAYAVSIDGLYVGASHFNRSMRDTNICEIEPVFSKNEAEKILKHLEKNYNHFN